jgi:hypothetical protein
MAQHSELTTRSIRFSGCVGVGLVMSIVQGIPALEIAQAALLASTLFLALMVGEAVKARFAKKKKKKITL